MNLLELLKLNSIGGSVGLERCRMIRFLADSSLSRSFIRSFTINCFGFFLFRENNVLEPHVVVPLRDEKIIWASVNSPKDDRVFNFYLPINLRHIETVEDTLILGLLDTVKNMLRRDLLILSNGNEDQLFVPIGLWILDHRFLSEFL